MMITFVDSQRKDDSGNPLTICKIEQLTIPSIGHTQILEFPGMPEQIFEIVSVSRYSKVGGGEPGQPDNRLSDALKQQIARELAVSANQVSTIEVVFVSLRSLQNVQNS